MTLFCIIIIVVMAMEPEFVEPLQNVTVTAGRDIKLQCSVKHLNSFKVSPFHSITISHLSVERSAENSLKFALDEFIGSLYFN